MEKAVLQEIGAAVFRSEECRRNSKKHMQSKKKRKCHAGGYKKYGIQARGALEKGDGR